MPPWGEGLSTLVDTLYPLHVAVLVSRGSDRSSFDLASLPGVQVLAQRDDAVRRSLVFANMSSTRLPSKDAPEALGGRRFQKATSELPILRAWITSLQAC